MIRGDRDQRQICIRGDVDLRKQRVHASDELLGKSQLLPLIKLSVLSLKVQQKRSKTGCNIFVTCVFAIWLLMIGSSLQLRMHYYQHRMASAQAVNQGGPEKPAAKSHFNVCFRQSVYYTIIGRGKSATSQAVNAGSLHPTADEADHQPCMHD